MTANDSIRVVVADDHTVVRAGLTAILQADVGIRVVAEAGNGEQAVRAVAEHRPDVTVLDIRMPVLDGLAALVQIRRADAAARVILLTTFDDEEDICRGLEAGASGYLLKDAAADELVDGIRRVMDGRKVICGRAAERLVERVASRALSDREREVLQRLAEGLSNKQIAKQLRIASGTVKVHVANILEKLGAQGRSEAVAVAARRGLVRLD